MWLKDFFVFTTLQTTNYIFAHFMMPFSSLYIAVCTPIIFHSDTIKDIRGYIGSIYFHMF